MAAIEEFSKKLDELESFCKEWEVPYEREENRIEFNTLGLFFELRDSENGPMVEITNEKEDKYRRTDVEVGKKLSIDWTSVEDGLDRILVRYSDKLVAEGCSEENTFVLDPRYAPPRP